VFIDQEHIAQIRIQQSNQHMFYPLKTRLMLDSHLIAVADSSVRWVAQNTVRPADPRQQAVP